MTTQDPLPGFFMTILRSLTRERTAFHSASERFKYPRILEDSEPPLKLHVPSDLRTLQH